MKQEVKELFELSNRLKKEYRDLIESGQVKVNELIVEYYKIQDQFQELRTFKAWANDGYKVIKGSKAYKVFSTPIKNEETKETKFYIANLFSNKQVTKS
jgi:hypothetical protein